MKHLNKIIGKFFLFFFVTNLALAPISYSYSQVKIKDFSGIEDESKKGADSLKNIATYVLATVLGVALIFVVWEVATGKQNAKEHVIAWIIAVFLVILAGLII